MATKTSKLPCFGIIVQFDPETGAGTIVSDLYVSRTENDEPNTHLKVAIDALEALILAHACAGVDVQSPGYIEGIETAVEAVFNKLD